MVRHHLGLVCVLAAGIASASLTAPLIAGDRSLPMHFELRQEGGHGCPAAKCRQFISAAGAITADTPLEFRDFAAGKSLQDAVLVLDSDGGSVLGAIALGREVRDLKLATTVGRLTDVGTPAKGGVQQAALSPRADCESMCAFVLLAGVKRSVAPEARVMVHQIWLGDRREDPTAANYSAEDLVLVQRDIGRLAKYTADMGGPAELLELALRIPPWEPMHALTSAELQQMGFEAQEVAPAPVAQAPVAAATISYAPGTVATRTDDLDERGWSMIERAGVSVLGRRHPLTVEGDEIGSFDLVVSCGDADSYLVSYNEDRQADAGAVLPVTGVSLRFGAQTAALKVVSSTQGSRPGTLTTVAAGVVPANLIKGFTAPGSHSLTIDTATAGLRTTIRLGNSGAHSNLPLLASRCPKTAPTHAAELPVQQRGSGGVAQR